MKRFLLRILLLCLAAVIAVAAWVLAATFTNSIPALSFIAFVAFCSTGAFLLAQADVAVSADVRGEPTSRPRLKSRLKWLLGGAAVYMAVAQLAVGRSPRRMLGPVQPVPGMETWTMSDGATIAYIHVPARMAPRGPPVLVLHDGPGMPVLTSVATGTFRPLDVAADSGVDVYYFDQRGAGLSDRLDLRDSEPYTVAGHVRDLEEIRTLIGADRVTLAGQGWGATLAVNYLAEHADHVEKLVVLSPAPLWYATMPDFVDPSARARISEVQASALAVLKRPPLRLLIGRLTAMTSPRAAHTLVHDWEADQWWTDAMREAYRLGQPRLTCRSDPSWHNPRLDGLGYFAYSYTVADALKRPDPRPAVVNLDTETLVVRGLCDYVQGRVAQEYLDALQASVYVAIPGAGHLIWTEQQGLLDRVLAAFLLGRDVPLSLYSPRKGTAP